MTHQCSQQHDTYNMTRHCINNMTQQSVYQQHDMLVNQQCNMTRQCINNMTCLNQQYNMTHQCINMTC